MKRTVNNIEFEFTRARDLEDEVLPKVYRFVGADIKGTIEKGSDGWSATHEGSGVHGFAWRGNIAGSIKALISEMNFEGITL